MFQYLFMQKNAFHEIRPALQPVIERAIHRFMERYRLSYDEAHHFHDQLWMHAHGIASMAATEFCQWNLGGKGKTDAGRMRVLFEPEVWGVKMFSNQDLRKMIFRCLWNSFC